MRRLSLCLLALTLVGCGKAKEMPFFPSAPMQPYKVIDSNVTADYKSLLMGTMYSQDGSITFKEDGTVSITKKIDVLNSSDVYHKNYNLLCSLERIGKYEILENAQDKVLKLVIKPSRIEVLSSSLQTFGSSLDIENEDEKNKKIDDLCQQYAGEEMKGQIEMRLMSISKNHLHLVYRTFFNNFDPEWALSSDGNDFTNFFIRNESELDVAELFLSLYQGQYQSNKDKVLTLKPNSLTDSVAFEYKDGECESEGEFMPFYSLEKGLQVRMLTEAKCFQPNPMFMSATMFDIMYKKKNNYIHLMLPMGNFTKVIQRKQDLRL